MISAVLAAITPFFGLMLITVLLSVPPISAGKSRRSARWAPAPMMADVLWRSALLVGTGGLLAYRWACAVEEA